MTTWRNFNTRYGWGCWGQPITSAIITQKAQQYPAHYDAARQRALNALIGRGYLTDCVGLIKGYYWGQQPGDTLVGYDVHSDVSADGMYYNAKIRGPMATMPDVPGICVQLPGHIGVYVGNGYVIESTRGFYGDGVTKTRLSDRGWVHWLQCPYITYENGGDKSVIKVDLPDVKCEVDGVKVENAYILNIDNEDRTYIPLRFFTELGYKVEWDATNQVAKLTIKGG